MAELPSKYSIRAILDAAWDGWTYDKYDPENQIRARSQRVRNTVDQAMGLYMEDLKKELQKKRQEIPEPTRENPFPDPKLLQQIKEQERYLRKVEEVRTQIQGLEVPIKSSAWNNKEEQIELLERLERMDEEIFSCLRDIDADQLERIENVIKKRKDVLSRYNIG